MPDDSIFDSIFLTAAGSADLAADSADLTADLADSADSAADLAASADHTADSAAGAKKMGAMVKNVRAHKTGNKMGLPPKAKKNPMAYLKKV